MTNITLTAEEIDQWNLYGCQSRSLMRVSELAGKPISREEFCARFGHLFIFPKMFGMVNPKGFEEIVKSLGLASSLRWSGSYDDVKDTFNNEGRQVVLFSTVDLRPGGTGVLNHCSVLSKIDDRGFRIWSACQSGGEFEMDFVKADWNGKKFQGRILE